MENNQENKTQISPMFNNLFVLPYEDNPYMLKENEDGFLYNDDEFDNPDTGEKDKLDQCIVCGKVIAAGFECKFIKEGDDIMYNKVSVTPVPFMRQGFYILNERAVIAVLAEDLDKREVK